MKLRNSIGVKLITAFTLFTLLLCLVCSVAWFVWSRLNGQVNILLESAVPHYSASYLLESRSNEFRHQVEMLVKTSNKAELAELQDTMKKQFNSIHQIDAIDDKSALKANYEQLAVQMSQLSERVFNKISTQRKVDSYYEQLSWLHQDIRDELHPLYHELLWQLERDYEAPNRAFELLGFIQRALDLENKIFELSQEIHSKRKSEFVNNSLEVLYYHLEELNTLSKPIFDHPSSLSYQQLLKSFNDLLHKEGHFHKLLIKRVLLLKELDQLSRITNQQLDSIHQQIANVVVDADQTFHKVQSDTSKTVTYGSRALIISFSISILFGIALTYYYVHRGVVVRLHNLSQRIDSTIKGDLTYPSRLKSSDEISQLEHKLSEYGNKVQEMQRTNALNLINNTTASIITCDLSGNIESANSSAKALLGLTQVSYQQPVWICSPSGSKHQIKTMFENKSSLYLKQYDQLTVAHLIQSRIHYLRFDFRLFEQTNTHKVIITITDITEQTLTAMELESLVEKKTRDLRLKNKELHCQIQERERAEESLKNTQSELIQAAKMAVVGQTMTSLAHELNQPLNAMSTYIFSANHLGQKYGSQKLQDMLAKIDELHTRMSNLVNNLRRFARKDNKSASIEPVELMKVVNQAITLVYTKAKQEGVSIDVNIASDAVVVVSELGLEQVLINLLVNSFEAISETVSSSKKVSIETLEHRNNLCTLIVSDSGTGFNSEITQHLFTPFTTTKEVGLGLGLNICKSLVHASSGEIYLASNLSKGAMIVMELQYESK
ncbi:ATP-binding protein [Vibrio sp. HN007]|uniref:ATP-binding protein n=1 Tax=Vibrio iocasae TaxID=3098914 RepID=UPI0035D48109